MQKLFIVLALIGFSLFSLERVVPLTPVRTFVQTIASPISYGLYTVGFGIKSGVDFTVSLPKVYFENETLKEEIVRLSGVLVDFDVLERENRALKRQLEVEEEHGASKILATILGVSEVGRSIEMVIDKGSGDGLTEGQSVLSGEYLIGRIVRVSYTNAYVMPIFAVGSKIPSEILPLQPVPNEKRIKGIVHGYFNNQVVLNEILQEHILFENDLVVTSGEGGIYPPGLLLGRIDTISSSDSEIFQQATIEPFWELGDVRTVFVYAQD